MPSEEITTSRLNLRPFRLSDVPAVFAYLQEPEMGRFLEGSPQPPTERETEAIIARHMLADPEIRAVWAVTIGDVAVGGISIDFEKSHRIAQIGYSIKKDLWGQGFATEAASAVVDDAFASYPELHRVQANIHPQNRASIRVVEKIGMDYEGTLRSYAYVHGKPADEAIYAILRSIWLDSRG